MLMKKLAFELFVVKLWCPWWLQVRQEFGGSPRFLVIELPALFPPLAGDLDHPFSMELLVC
jgi:hypothetical protein